MRGRIASEKLCTAREGKHHNHSHWVTSSFIPVLVQASCGSPKATPVYGVVRRQRPPATPLRSTIVEILRPFSLSLKPRLFMRGPGIAFLIAGILGASKGFLLSPRIPSRLSWCVQGIPSVASKGFLAGILGTPQAFLGRPGQNRDRKKRRDEEPGGPALKAWRPRKGPRNIRHCVVCFVESCGMPLSALFECYDL